MSYLEKSILGTIIYYNNLGQPLTSFEVYKYLVRPVTRDYLANVLNAGYGFSDVFTCLEKSLRLKEFIQRKNGFCFLIGKEHLIRQRIIKHRIAIKKWKKVRRMAKILQGVPFMRMVAVSGSLAVNNTRKKSDMDLLIVVKQGRIWMARALVTLVTQVLGVRRHRKLTADRFCLNHYITDGSLCIPFQSLYNAQSYARLALVYQCGNEAIYSCFQKANSWIAEYLFNIKEQKTHFRAIRQNILKDRARTFLEILLGGILGDILEKICKTYQIYRISKDPLTEKVGGRVTFNDEQLEFHPDSPELKIIQSFNKKTFELGLLEYTNQEDSGLTK